MSRGPYTISWGILGEGSQESRREVDLEDALRVADATQGTIFDQDGQQLSREDIDDALHPYRKLAKEIAGTLMHGTGSRLAEWLEVQDHNCRRIGTWTVESAVKAIELCLEGSGLS